MTHLFKGELQLLRWSETSNQGAVVTFQLSDVRDLDAFKDLTLAKKGMAGQRIAAMMMLVDDLDAAIEDAETVYVAYEEPKNKPGDLCIMACKFCADTNFHYWVYSVCMNRCLCEEDAKQFILRTCNTTSRKYLDTDHAAKHIFLTEIRAPFLEWKEANLK
jgi:hypothetical protein